MARALQHLAAAGRLVGEPAAPRGRAEHARGEQAERPLGEQLPHVGEPVDRPPLVADRAHDARALDRVDDHPRVVEIARHGLLEVDRQRALERGHGDLAVQARRRQHEDGVGPPALEQRLPVAEALGAGRPGRPRQTRRVGIADARDLLSQRAQALQMRLRDPAAADQADPHATTSPFAQDGARTPAHLGSIPHARVESLAERLRCQRPGRLRIPHQQIGGHPRLDHPPAAQELRRQLDRQARVAQARGQHQRHARRHARPARDELVEGGRRTRAAVRVIGADGARACRRARPARPPRRARAGAAAVRSRPSRPPGRRRRSRPAAGTAGTSRPSRRGPRRGRAGWPPRRRRWTRARCRPGPRPGARGRARGGSPPPPRAAAASADARRRRGRRPRAAARAAPGSRPRSRSAAAARRRARGPTAARAAATSSSASMPSSR